MSAPSMPPPAMPPLDAVGSAIWVAFWLGIGACCFIACLTGGINARKDWDTLHSDAANQTTGHVTAATFKEGDDGYGNKVIKDHELHYEFFVPASRTVSRLEINSPTRGIGKLGARVTSRIGLSEDKYKQHSEHLPKACTVRYLSTDPRLNEICAIGDDDDPCGHKDKPSLVGFCCLVFPLGLLLIALAQTLGAWHTFGTGALTAFFIVIGLMTCCSVLSAIGARPNLSVSKIESLAAPYEEPTKGESTMESAAPGAVADEVPVQIEIG